MRAQPSAILYLVILFWLSGICTHAREGFRREAINYSEPSEKTVDRIVYGDMEDVRSVYVTKDQQFVDLDEILDELKLEHDIEHKNYKNYLKSLPLKEKAKLNPQTKALKKLHNNFWQQYENAKWVIHQRESLADAYKALNLARDANDSFMGAHEDIMPKTSPKSE